MGDMALRRSHDLNADRRDNVALDAFSKSAMRNMPSRTNPKIKAERMRRGQLDHITAVVPDSNQPDILGPNVGFGAVDRNDYVASFAKYSAKRSRAPAAPDLARDDHASPQKTDVVQVLGTSTSGPTASKSGYFYPLFHSQAEAESFDRKNGGKGQSHTHTFAGSDGKVFYMPNTEMNHAEAKPHQAYRVIEFKVRTKPLQWSRPKAAPLKKAAKTHKVLATDDSKNVVVCNPDKTPRHIPNPDCVDAVALNQISAPFCAQVGNRGVCTSSQCGATQHCPAGYWCGNNVCRLSKAKLSKVASPTSPNPHSRGLMVALVIVAIFTLAVVGVIVSRK